MPPTWLQLADHFAQDSGLDPRIVDVLRAFDGPPVPMPVADFPALEALCSSREGALGDRILKDLSSEIDQEQAQIFSRRYAAVLGRLSRRTDPSSRVLRVGLVQRVEQVLNRVEPGRALRIRSVVDYLYSQVALLEATEGGPAPTIAELAAAATWQPVAPGVDRALIDGPTDHGPQHINLLRCAPGSVDLQMTEIYPTLTTTLARYAAQHGAIAACSGGFFLYSEPNIALPSRRHDPVGLLVQNATVLHPAVLRRGALVQRADGAWQIRVLGPRDHDVFLGEWVDVSSLNPINRAQADRASGVAIVANQIIDAGPDVEVPLNGVVLDWSGPIPDEPVRWRMRDPAIRHAIAAGPVLLRAGRVGFDLVAEDFAGSAPPQTFSGDETGDRNLLPRLAIGISQDSSLIIAAVDGRNLTRALGLPLHSLAELLAAVGCDDGLNMDGGSSKRLVIDGRAVDLPTTDLVADGNPTASARPVHTAILMQRRT